MFSSNFFFSHMFHLMLIFSFIFLSFFFFSLYHLSGNYLSFEGVPPTYPMDEELIKLCMVNQLQRLGLAEHFKQEIEEVLEHVYR